VVASSFRFGLAASVASISLALMYAGAPARSAWAVDVQVAPGADLAAGTTTGDVTLGAVVIEAEPIAAPTIDELLRGFRDALDRDRLRNAGDIVERQLAGGMLEVNTRYGRFCFAPLPTYLASDLTSGINLASRCTAY
jgi:hypothetical protein